MSRINMGPRAHCQATYYVTDFKGLHTHLSHHHCSPCHPLHRLSPCVVCHQIKLSVRPQHVVDKGSTHPSNQHLSQSRIKRVHAPVVGRSPCRG